MSSPNPGTPAAEISSAQAWQLPACTVEEFRPRRSVHAVCVFVVNEGARIRAQLERMEPYAREMDILVCDGGSTDGSLERGELARRGVRALLTKTGPGRLSAQMRMGLAYALRQDYAGCIVMDGNGKDGVEALPAFRSALDEGFDHVQGSRYVLGGVAENTPFLRHWGVKLLHAPLISIAAGRRYTDTTNGFRAYSRKLLLDPRVQPFRDVFSGYELHYYLAIRAARLGFAVKEIPVARSYPAAGPAPTKISGWRGNLNILRTLLAVCSGRYNP